MKKWLLLIVVLAGLALLATRNLWRPGAPAAPPAAAPERSVTSGSCGVPAHMAEAARANAASLATVEWAPFGAPERGWDVYAAEAAREIGTRCGPETPAFAAALATWQREKKLPATGQLDAATFEAMRVAWMLRRPFVQATRSGGCPASPAEATLATAGPNDGYWGKAVQLRPGALEAYRRMRAAARREVPEVAADPRLLALVSGYRGPGEEARRCAGGGCGGPARASCSAHRTGLAVDLHLGAAPGFESTSSADENRSWQAATPAYRWLVRNAHRFGFVSYPYEPWHWEWTGEPVVG